MRFQASQLHIPLVLQSRITAPVKLTSNETQSALQQCYLGCISVGLNHQFVVTAPRFRQRVNDADWKVGTCCQGGIIIALIIGISLECNMLRAHELL
jgi:hypothetical protein